MFAIQDKLISEDLLSEYFACNLDKCKGVCCREGDYGAPLEDEEKKILDDMKDMLHDELEPDSALLLEEKGPYQFFEENKKWGTTLHNDGRCVFLKTENGIDLCALESLHMQGKSSFLKPVSCHLYPVRIENLSGVDIDALNYNQWDICNPACHNGKERNIKVYEFAKEAMVRKYGKDFYEELDAAAKKYF